MNCMGLMGSSGRATQCASSSTADALDDEENMAQSSRPIRFVGAPLIMEAASKVDKCLARLQSLQGTVTVPAPSVPATSSTCLSPNFGRSRSCLHGSPRVHDDDKIRIHDVLRWSDDFSGKIKQERRDKYMKRLARSKTEVFDDKKDPLDPHGEWKHWSSPAGDVHKVVSEILMASQIAKQITSMVNAALVQTDVSSDDGRTSSSHGPENDTAASRSNTRSSQRVQTKRKDDPLHKFRVVVASDGAAKKRTNVGSRKELLYPKSKPDRSRPADENQVLSSIAKKMQSRRTPRVAVVESRPRANVWAAKEITNRKSPPCAMPSQESKKVVPVNDKLLSSTLRRVRTSRSPPWTIVEKPQLGIASEAVKPCFIVKQGSRGPPVEGLAEPGVVTSSATVTTGPPTTTITSDRRALPADTVLLSSTSEETPATNVVISTEAPVPSTQVPELHASPASPELSVEPEPDGHVTPSCSSPRLPSSFPECRPPSGESSPQLQHPVGSNPPSAARSNPLIGSLRHKFVMEVTEIKGPNKPWRLHHAKSDKAVLFSNAAFAPASPPGARPAPEKAPTSASPPKSPIRSSSATRRVFNRIGRALSAGGRSISPEITHRLSSTRQKLISLSPGNSLPSLISRLPSRGKKSSSAPRASILRTPLCNKPSPIVKTPACTKPAPISAELPLPPGRKAQQQHGAAQETVRTAGHSSVGLPVAATDSSLRDVRQLKGKGGNSQFQSRMKTNTASKKRNLVKGHRDRGSNWENQAGVVGVLSSCRRWVEESSPPLPGARFEKDEVEPVPRRTQKENVVPPGWDDEVGATDVLSSYRSGADENVRPVVEESLPPLPGGSFEKDEVGGTVPRRTQKENVMPTGWDDEVGVIGVLSSCRSRADENVLPAAIDGAHPGELKRSWSAGSRRSSSTGKVRPGSTLLQKARDWVRTQTPNRDGPRQPERM